MISIVMGSKSDYNIIKDGIDVLNKYKIPFDVRVFSAHRSPQGLLSYINSTEQIKLFIAIAGGAAHLAGVIAAHTIKPVIGVPVQTGLDGLDSLLATVQMPAGVPVATVAINGFTNAVILALQILAVSDDRVRQQLSAYKRELSAKVEYQDSEVKELVKNQLNNG